jgi:hypothetical protein
LLICLQKRFAITAHTYNAILCVPCSKQLAHHLTRYCCCAQACSQPTGKKVQQALLPEAAQAQP